MAEIINIISQETAEAVATNPTFWNKTLSFLGQYWWVGLIIIALLGLILWGIWRLLENLKATKYPVYELYKERKSMCKQQRDVTRYRSFFKPKKNQPVVCQYMENGIMTRRTIGHYYGDYYSNEGNRNLAFFKKGDFLWFIIPVVKILLLNKTSKMTIKVDKKEGKKKFSEDIVVELPTNIDFFTSDEIVLLGSKSVDKIDADGLFYVPVLAESTTKSGQLDFSSFAYKQLTDVIKGEQLITNLNYFVTANKKALEINPLLRTKKQIDDTNSEVGEDD